MLLSWSIPILVVLLFVSIGAGILGPFLLWNRMSFFSDVISHSAILSVAVALIFDINAVTTIVTLALLLSIILVFFNHTYPNDTILNVFNGTSVALGITLLYIYKESSSIGHLLFGNILFINTNDVLCIMFVVVSTAIIFLLHGDKWIFLSINRDIFSIENSKNVLLYELELFTVIAVFIAISIQALGVLLVTSILVIPGTIAYLYARKPAHMFLWSILICFFSSCLSFLLSIKYNLQTTPIIVLVMICILLISNILKYFKIL
ncbi:MAG: ABC 3 transport family protein [Candidatus Xenolissoclinum pacificiensis L6]|uniref:ABC 3 transport family protein n=1 Tax=Candidatus Xenolissoclinum pacificiensis L6 TaxID=1401685 RepID=W2V2D3_9RICK|nr:MAG: ABC 3 transport family protein [Candidatus Xenolissoclinum pacificiensis L6]